MTYRTDSCWRLSRRLILAAVSALLVVVVLANAAVAAGMPRANAASGPRRGGTMVVSWETTLTTLDPAYVYGVQDWPQAHAIYDGLLGFGAGANLLPHLATAVPVATNGGKTYTFHLKKGLVFSNGDPVTAPDFVFSWERMLAAKTASPDTYLWYALQGQSAYTAGKAAHVSGLKALDASTLQVTLTQPYPGFLFVLATPSSFVVDPAVIHQYHAETKDVGVHAVGSGPFALKDWTPGQRMDLVRNPRYWYPTWPYVDAVHLDLGVNASVGVLRMQKGQSDLMGDAIPSAQFASIIQDPTLSKLVAHTPDIGVYMIGLNTRLKPFSSLLVRRAISYAINKQRAIRFINGRGVAATGILPPNLPGFSGSIPEQYPYDPVKAKSLLTQAGYPNGFSTTMGVPSGGYEARMADSAIYDLAAVGIKVTVKPVLSEGAAIATLPMVAYHWIQDYPDPADFIDGFTSCASATPNGSNVSFYCNPALDALANKARGIPFGPARVAAYNHIDQLYMADAPSVPVFNDILYYMHSARLQGYYISPQWFPFTLEQYWLSS